MSFSTTGSKFEQMRTTRPQRCSIRAGFQFGQEVLECPQCGGRMKLVAAILDPVEIARLCENLGEPTQAPPVKPSRYKPQTGWDFAAPP